jgi:phosphoribosylformimino-5-aminoimidazole carboxamide ribotide isomerase
MIWAAVDIMDGQCVQLKGGDPSTARFQQVPLQAAKHWVEQGADGLHIIDLNAALGNGNNNGIIEEIVQAVDVPVQIGGGIRDLRVIERWFNLGIKRLIIGTRGIKEPKWLAEMTHLFPNRIVLAIDARDDEIAISGWTENSGQNLYEFAEAVSELPLAGLLYTNVGIEGSMEGIDPAPVLKLCTTTSIPVLVSGGLKDEDDVLAAYQLGAEGVVLGTALYTDDIDLKKLQHQLKQALAPPSIESSISESSWVQVQRKTRETNIDLNINLHGTGKVDVDIEIFFLKHMLESFAVHGQIDLKISATGDNDHHLIEDVGIVLGQAIRKAISNMKIQRIAHSVVPMDEALVMVAIDLVDRPYAQVNLPDPMYAHFMRSMALDGKFTLHVRPLAGEDVHHTVEAGFKAFGRALHQAVQPIDQIASTKGEVDVQ